MDAAAVDPDAVQSMRQLCTVWAAIVADRGTGEIRDLPGMAVRWAESDFAFWNTLTLTEAGIGEATLGERLRSAAAYMRSRRKAGLLWLFEDLLAPAARAGLPRLIDEAGLTLALPGFGMAGDVLPVPEPAAAGLTFRRVRTEGDLEAYADINARAYGMPVEAARDGLSGSALWREGMHAFLGLKGGEPVTAAATVEADGCLFVALVATLPEHQRRGYAEAVMRRALRAGAEGTGLRRATLHATLAGAPVYERIGLRKVATMGFYGLKG